MTFDEARACVLREVPALRDGVEQVHTLEAAGRVLAENISADRDYPPFARSARDGFAVRSADVPGELEVVGEVRAGAVYEREVTAGTAIEIMTGAPLPRGADAVVMVEHVEQREHYIAISRSIKAGDNFTPRGTEAKRG